MTRRMSVFGFALALALSVGFFPAQAADGQPNFVILFADDLGYGDLGSYGHPYIRTPNLDRLAREGQRWTDFYVADPVCSPSRGALLTGRLPVRTGLYGRQIGVLFPDDTAGMPANEVTVAEVLSSAGYATAVIGKWHLGDQPDVYPTRHGFDYWYGIPYSNDMNWVDMPTLDESVALRAAGRADEIAGLSTERMRRYFDPKVEYWDVPIVRSEITGGRFRDELVERPAVQPQLTKRYTEEAISFIDRSDDRPFFLYVPYSMPHTPIFASADFAGKSAGGRYADVIQELDWSVGRIVAALEEHGLADDTLVVFTSDNGPWLFMNHHGGSAGLLNNGKGTTFEGGMRVPAVFSWPGRIAEGTVSEIGSTLDLFDTVLSMAGLPRPDNTDGFDLSPTLLSRAPSPRDSIAYYRSGELRAFRQGAFKLHLVTEGAYGMPPTRQVHDPAVLHHLTDDPSERFDVAAEYPEVVERIRQAIERHRASVDVAPPIFDQRLARGR